MSSSIRLPAIDQLRPKPYAEGVLASREWLRLFAVVGAIVIDLTLLLVASALAAYLRYGNITSGSSGVLLLMLLPA